MCLEIGYLDFWLVYHHLDKNLIFWGCVPLTHTHTCQWLLSKDMSRDEMRYHALNKQLDPTMSWSSRCVLVWRDGMPFSWLQTECPGMEMLTDEHGDMMIWSSFTRAEQFLGGCVDGFVDVRPQFVVSPLLITRCAEECPKGPHVGFPETNLLGIPFFPGINIKISCTVVV